MRNFAEIRVFSLPIISEEVKTQVPKIHTVADDPQEKTRETTDPRV